MVLIINRTKRKLQNRVLNWVLSQDGKKFSQRFNLFRKFLGYVPYVTWDYESKVYRFSDSSGSLYVSRISRLRYYKKGVAHRLNFLVSEYLCDTIEFSDGDLLIDVGANIGEFSYALSRDVKLKVLAFEPESVEKSALRLNLQDVKAEIYEFPLWSSTSEIDFYPSNETGDSSLIRQDDNCEPIRMKCFSLDDVLSECSLVKGQDRIKLLKLEAEGAEPEILQGFEENLHRVEYVTADVGAERGLGEESTLIQVQSILIKAGFEPIRFGLPRAVMLFRNTRL